MLAYREAAGRQVLARLEDSFQNILAELASTVMTVGPRGQDLRFWTGRRLIGIRQKVDELARQGVYAAFGDIRDAAIQIAYSDARWLSNALQEAGLRGSFAKRDVRRRVVYSPFEGQTLMQWRRAYAAMTRGVVLRATQSFLVDGQRDGAFESIARGGFAKTFRDLKTVFNTAMTHAGALATQEVAKKFGAKRVLWVSVLDNRTSDICLNLDGSIFPIDEGPRPPAHFNCRSIVIPLFWDDDVTYVSPEEWATRLGLPRVKKFTDAAPPTLTLDQLRKFED